MNDRSPEENKNFVPRITQLDANEFDKEVYRVLSSELFEVSKFLQPGALSSVKNEINLLLNLLIFRFSVVNNNATFGQELLSLKYQTSLSKKQALVFALLNYCLPYLKNKYEDINVRTQCSNVKKIIEKIEILFKTSQFLNLLFFLREGKYPTVVDRLLKLSYSSVKKSNQGVGYNYMTRELLWHGFMEFLIYLLPLINFKVLKQKVRRTLLTAPEQIKSEKNIILNTDTKCVICNDFPIIPCQISIYCPHLACYYCVKSNVLADEKFMCPICSERNTAYEKLYQLQG